MTASLFFFFFFFFFFWVSECLGVRAEAAPRTTTLRFDR